MTSLDPDPLIVSLVQVANTLPIFLLALPAGALADVADRRRFLFWNEAIITALSGVFAVFVALDLVTARLLLLFTFLIGIGGALTAPAWQAIVPQLVPRRDLAPFLFGSAYWALLPLVARNQIAGGPELYGIMLGVIGVGAVTGAFALPWFKKSLGADRGAAAGTLGTAVALILFGLARDTLTGLFAS